MASKRVRREAPVLKLSIATCGSCGKQCFCSRRDARRFARARFPAAALRAYQCGDWWHVGNTQTRRKRGEL